MSKGFQRQNYFASSKMRIRTLLRTSKMYACSKRFRSECKPKPIKVGVFGASGGVGQPLSMLLKLNPCIAELRLHSLADTAGVALDLSHIETASKVVHSTGQDHLCEFLVGGLDIIVATAGIARKPGMSREDAFESNSLAAYEIAKGMSKYSPNAILLVVTNPVNLLVPVVCEVLKDAKHLCPGKILGVTTLDSVRAASFVAEAKGLNPKDVTVPVVGGHSEKTILPLFSRTNPKVCLEEEERSELIKRVQTAGTEVVKTKGGKGSATLSIAYATSRITFALIKALNGESDIVESAFVMSDVVPEVKYLSTPLVLGPNGVEKNLGLGNMDECEKKLFKELLPQLKNEIEKGEKFATEQICKDKAKKNT